MGRSLRAFALTLVLVRCGGDSASPPVGFINLTQHSTAALWVIWTAAQHDLVQKIDLNPLQQTEQQAAPVFLPGDPRALQTQPHQLQVVAEPDVSSSALLAATGIDRPNPTGMIACPQPCNVQYSTAYSFYAPPVTKYAASWEFEGNNFNSILEYEFQNQILFALGYDMRWR